jgi:hypothetical protein
MPQSRRHRRPKSLASSLTTYNGETVELSDLPTEVPAKLQEAAGTPAGEALPEGVKRWEGVIGVEGEMTGDGRLIAVNALRWPEDLSENPIPLRYVSSDVGAHDGAQVVGVIDQIQRLEADEDGSVPIWGAGFFDDDENAVVAAEAYRHVDKKLSNGVSMDLDDVVFEVQSDAAHPELETMTTQDARIRAATIVAIPAFNRAKIGIVGTQVAETEAAAAAPVEAVAASMAAVTPKIVGTVKYDSDRGKRAQAITKARLSALAGRPGATFAYQTTRVKDSNGEWVETPAAAVDIAQNVQPPEDCFQKGLDLLLEADQLELGSADYVAKIEEALPEFQDAVEEGGDRGPDATKIVEILEAYLAVDWEKPAEDEEDAAQPAPDSEDQPAEPAAQPDAPAAPAQPAAAGQGMAAKTGTFAFNPDQWRNPKNGQWIDMPGRILGRLESGSTDMDVARDQGRLFVENLNDGDVASALGNLGVIRAALNSEIEDLSPDDEDYRGELDDALDKIGDLETVDWYSAPVESDGIASWDEPVEATPEVADAADYWDDQPLGLEDEVEEPETVTDADLDVDYADVVGLLRDMRDAISSDDVPESVLHYLEDMGATSSLTQTPLSVAWLDMERALAAADVDRARRARDEVFDALDSMLPASEIIRREEIENEDEIDFLETVEEGFKSISDELRETLGKLGAKTTPLSSKVALAQRARFSFATYNWVEEVGGLPGYIRDIADSLMKKGTGESNAIATAVNTVKRWAKGGPARAGGKGSVSAKTQAKAAAALAEWETKKAAANANAANSITASMYALRTQPTSLVASGGAGAPSTVDIDSTIAVMEKQFSGYGRAFGSGGIAPIAPPKAWFTNPKFSKATPMQIDDDGRIYGHLASWNVCHIASPAGEGICVMAPKTRTGYAHFHTGAVKTAEGDVLATGRLTMNGRHAGPNASMVAAGAHYDNTTLAFADVVCGEDKYGIWVAGALRPQINAEQVRTLRASPLSGDWRRVGGNLELMLGLAVNGPGFSIPRPMGLVASAFGDSDAGDHELMSLVAAGMLPPAKVIAPGTDGAFSVEELKYLKGLASKEKAFANQQRVEAFVAERNRKRVEAFAAKRAEERSLAASEGVN